jgi:hypothetical protein
MAREQLFSKSPDAKYLAGEGWQDSVVPYRHVRAVAQWLTKLNQRSLGESR